MIPGHLPECDLVACFCPSDPDAILRVLADRAARSEKEQAELADVLWNLIAPRVEKLIESVFTELEGAPHG